MLRVSVIPNMAISKIESRSSVFEYKIHKSIEYLNLKNNELDYPLYHLIENRKKL